MGVLRKIVLALAVMLVSAVLWVGINLYLSYTTTELRGELLGSENVYEFLSKGMLDEVKISVHEDSTLPVEGLSVDLLEPIDPYFSKIAFEKIVEKIDSELIVSPVEFHQLQSDAVMRSFETEDTEQAEEL